MTTQPEHLGAKQTAALLRWILKKTFPATRFSVVTERGSMVSSVRVTWTDGPTTGAVTAITGRFEAGHFDGMTDSYDYAPASERTLLIDGVVYVAGVRYVSESRKISPALANKCIAKIAAYWGGVEVVPVAVPQYDGFKLEPTGIGNKPPRDDLGGSREEWYEAVHRSANDATKYTRGVAV